MASKLSTEEFVSQCIKIHNNFYIYTKTEYKGSKEDIIITCPIHGDFTQGAGKHKSGQGCPKCGRESSSNKRALSKTVILDRFKSRHGDKYSYSKSNITSTKDEIIITCPMHGDFTQTPEQHFLYGCRECGYEEVNNKIKVNGTLPFNTTSSKLKSDKNKKKLYFENVIKPQLIKNNLLWLDGDFKGWGSSYGDNLSYNCKCNICNKETMVDNKIRCYNCYPINSNSSLLEKEIVSFIQQNYKGKINTSVRDLIYNTDNPYPLELDIYLPDLNLAFEVNGTYWHSSKFKYRDYHQNKTEKALKHGIQLIHIWEHVWLNKQSIVKSMILNKLNKTPNKAHARKCTVKKVNHLEASLFLEINHLHGKGKPATVIKGLYSENKLVSIMSVSKDGELLRFASLLNHNIVGGFGKLFKALRPYIKYSYVDRDWSPNNLNTVYDKFFSKVGQTSIRYSYLEEYTLNIIPRQRIDFDNPSFKEGLLKIYGTNNFKYEV